LTLVNKDHHYECSYIEGLDRGTAESRWRSDRRVSAVRAERSRCHDNAVSAADNTRSSSPTLFNTQTDMLASAISAGVAYHLAVSQTPIKQRKTRNAWQSPACSPTAAYTELRHRLEAFTAVRAGKW